MIRDPMDEGDQAQDYQARHNAAALDAHRRAREQAASKPSATHCEWCATGLDPARKEAQPGCTLCVQCQATKERLAGGM